MPGRGDIYAMAECHIDDKMADNIYALNSCKTNNMS